MQDKGEGFGVFYVVLKGPSKNSTQLVNSLDRFRFRRKEKILLGSNKGVNVLFVLLISKFGILCKQN